MIYDRCSAALGWAPHHNVICWFWWFWAYMTSPIVFTHYELRWTKISHKQWSIVTAAPIGIGANQMGRTFPSFAIAKINKICVQAFCLFLPICLLCAMAKPNYVMSGSTFIYRIIFTVTHNKYGFVQFIIIYIIMCILYDNFPIQHDIPLINFCGRWCMGWCEWNKNIPYRNRKYFVFVYDFVPWEHSLRASKCPSSRGGAAGPDKWFDSNGFRYVGRAPDFDDTLSGDAQLHLRIDKRKNKTDILFDLFLIHKDLL